MIKWKLVAATCAALFATDGVAGQDAAHPNEGTPPRLIAGSISNLDYPSEAIRAYEQGSTKMLISVGADGSVADCQIVESSGSEALDTRTCAIARERFRFEPGRTADGVAAPSTYRQSVRWVLPDERPGMGVPAFYPIVIAMIASLHDGRIVACAAQVDGHAQTMPVEPCQNLFAAYPTWESLRPRLISATHVFAFTPQGSPLPGYRPEWGEMQGQSEMDVIIGPDGRTVGCARVGETNFAACPATGDHVPSFGPSSEAERRGRITSALFTISAR